MNHYDRNIIQLEIDARREVLVRDYPELWHTMVRAWQAPRHDDAVWLMYSANYLFNTQGLKWAVDPVLLNNRVPEAPLLDVRQDLKKPGFCSADPHPHGSHRSQSSGRNSQTPAAIGSFLSPWLLFSDKKQRCPPPDFPSPYRAKRYASCECHDYAVCSAPL